MKQALAALAISALATPAIAGPYVETKHEFTGTDEDFNAQTHQFTVGHDWKVDDFKPYIEGGLGTKMPDQSDENYDFFVYEVGSSVRITDQLSGYGKIETKYQFSDETSDWKVELGTKFRFW